MAIIKERKLHGLYIRIEEDGGRPKGAHVEYIEQARDEESGEVFGGRLVVEPVNPTDDNMTPLLGEIMVAQAAELDVLAQKVQKQAEQLRDLTTQLQYAHGEIRRLEQFSQWKPSGV